MISDVLPLLPVVAGVWFFFKTLTYGVGIVWFVALRVNLSGCVHILFFPKPFKLTVINCNTPELPSIIDLKHHSMRAVELPTTQCLRQKIKMGAPKKQQSHWRFPALRQTRFPIHLQTLEVLDRLTKYGTTSFLLSVETALFPQAEESE